ncbi:MAG: Gmad2 immunoglobulin-like domain-containing protein [Syntrophomonas sp.]|nr:Gmad2 immunoglobulin-like domain-containing protein [Syntrophomonas sp.]
MNKIRFVTIMVLILVLGLFSSGCLKKQSTNNPNPNETEPQLMEVAVYYLKSTEKENYLVREVHQVSKTPEAAQAALNELIKGNPVTAGASKVLPADTKVLGINIDQGLATVDFSAEVLRANVGSRGESLGIDSIVNTLTEFPTIQRVSFTVDGQAEKAMDWWGHIGLYEQPFQRNLANVFEPVIWVTAPVNNQVITSPVKISGNARVFEATVGFRLKDANGNVLNQGFATASEGAPGRGDFNAELTFKPNNPGKGQLEVFETSMKDGSDQHKVIIPVEWQ